jgi:UPF0755 protein
MSGFTNFNKEKFLEKAQTKEGYLFPDTYYLFSNTTEDNLLSAMEDNFNDKIRTVEEEIKNSGRSLKEVVTMASIIEKEVAKPEDRVVVSGILWKRIEKGIPLQVDAATSTYLSKGLPPAPICNPGLGAIKAALEPQDSSYFFYLTGKDGKTYFAKTFDEHKKNKEKYLNK